MLTKILIFFGFYNPFTHNQGDFILRIIPSWFSNDYINFEYSANGGRSWKIIQCCHDPYIRHSSDEYWYTMNDLRFRLGNGNFSHEKEKFSSYQKILDFEKQQLEKCKALNLELEAHRERNERNKEEAYKRANS